MSQERTSVYLLLRTCKFDITISLCPFSLCKVSSGCPQFVCIPLGTDSCRGSSPPEGGVRAEAVAESPAGSVCHLPAVWPARFAYLLSVWGEAYKNHCNHLLKIDLALNLNFIQCWVLFLLLPYIWLRVLNFRGSSFLSFVFSVVCDTSEHHLGICWT